MIFLFSSMFLYEYSTDMIARAAKISGYDGIEFWPETPHFWVDRDEEKLSPFLDIQIALHAPVLDLNPVSVNQKLSDLSLSETLYTIALAKKFKAKLVTVHAGKRSALREPVWADYLSLHRYLRISSNFAKIKNVSLALENSEQKINNLCKTAEEISFFIETYDLRFTFDIKHSNDKKFLELIDKISNVHASCNENGYHVEPSRCRDATETLRLLAENGYDGIITVELDDLGIGSLSFAKKVEILKKECENLRKIFKR